MQEPLILDRYRPLAHLGSGGHGSVVLAFDTRMARRVAIKRLPLPQTRTGAHGPRTGLAEARTAALLNHPNIVTVHEWDTDSDEAFIVMEALDGVSLAELLDSTREPVTLDEAAAVLADVSAALGHAHRNGVLHLDLKPANVVVTREGLVKVADFGVSALTDISGHASGTAGTIGYMPPEQLRGESLDDRTDAWALAALLYELLANANPFDADTAEGSLFKIEVADVPAPSEFEAGLSEAIDDVLLAALAPEPDERYETVAEFAAALRPFLGDPDAGRASLAALLEDADEDFEEEPYALGLWDRLAPHAGTAVRIAAAVAAAWLAWSGMSQFTLGVGASLAATLLAAAAGALAPALGLALGLLLFAAGLGVAVGWMAGLGFAVLAVGFWLGRGRFGRADGLAAVAAPLLGIVRAAPVLPLALGFAFEPLAATLSSGAAALALTAASALTGGTAPLLRVAASFGLDPMAAPGSASGFWSRFGDPGVGVIVLAWMAAGAITSLACRRATRAAGFLGVLLGGVVLIAGYAGWAWLAGDAFGAAAYAPDLAVGIALALAIAALGAPTRPEEE